MRVSRRVATGVFICVASGVFAAPAWAQRESGPFAGLFGGGNPQDKQQTLSFNWSAYSGFDDTIAQQSALFAKNDANFRRSGQYAGGTVGIEFNRNSARNQFSASASTSARTYGATRDPITPVYGGGMSLGLGLTSRTSFQASFGGSFASFYQFAPFLVETPNVDRPDIIMPEFNYAAARENSVSTYMNLGLSQALSKHSSVSGNIGWSDMYSLGASAGAINGRGLNVRYQTGVTRDVGFHLGYGYRRGSFGGFPQPDLSAADKARLAELIAAANAALAPATDGSDVPDEDAPAADSTGAVAETAALQTSPHSVGLHDFDLGLDFNHALSLTRHTTMTFGSGTSMTKSADGTRRLMVTGQASLHQQFGRTWSGSIGYSRGADFVAGLNDLVISNGVMAGVNGQMGQRVKFDASTNFSMGTIGSRDGGHLDSITTTATLTVGITRSLGLYMSGQFYRYDSPAINVFAVEGVPPQLSRSAVMFGVNGWLPIINDERSSRDSR